MNHLSNEKLLQSLNWRYATQAFDAARKIPADTWAALEQALVLTPTSYGLQPYRFMVVQDAAKRAMLLLHSYGNKQLLDCSHYVVFTVRTEMAEADVDKLVQRVSQVRGVAVDTLGRFRNSMLRDLVNGPRNKIAQEWATRQAYIALGNVMTCSAVLGVDACPMEGLVPAEYDKVLNLAGSGYATVVACALGYRAPTDKYANLAKVRYETKDVVKYI
jgi:nitroreductase